MHLITPAGIIFVQHRTNRPTMIHLTMFWRTPLHDFGYLSARSEAAGICLCDERQNVNVYHRYCEMTFSLGLALAPRSPLVKQ